MGTGYILYMKETPRKQCVEQQISNLLNIPVGVHFLRNPVQRSYYRACTPKQQPPMKLEYLAQI
jgi:hypothetical protein